MVEYLTGILSLYALTSLLGMSQLSSANAYYSMMLMGHIGLWREVENQT